jgi:hypothetical protein
MRQVLKPVLSVEPIFLAVPGNHDLSRPPSATDPVGTVLAKLATTSPGEAAQYWDEIFTNPNSPYSKFIDELFSAYRSWWRPWANDAQISLQNWREGVLPGEFAAQFEKDGARFGLIGLNSTFLQVKGGDFFGKLAIDPRQLGSLLPTEDRAWMQEMAASILITHQPPSWLAPANRDGVFKPDIARSGRFAMHLCGHEHVAKTLSESRDGLPARRIGLGRALMAFEPTDDGYQRLMGYQAWRVSVNTNEGIGNIRCWPRKAEQQGSFDWKFVPDHSFNLDNDDGTEELPESQFRCPNYRRANHDRARMVDLNTIGPMSFITQDKDSPGLELEKKFFYNSWKLISEEISFITRRSRGFLADIRSRITADELVYHPVRDLQIDDDTILKIRYASSLAKLASCYNEIVDRLNDAILDYNRLVYPISGRHFIDTNTRGFMKRLDPEDWNEAKQKEEDEYYTYRIELMRELREIYKLGEDATVADLKTNTRYRADLDEKREHMVGQANELDQIVNDIDQKREYYDVALR